MRYEGRCTWCGEPVERQHAAWKVEGYEVAHSTGGANQIKNRERMPGNVWHQTTVKPCLDEWLEDQNGQGRLL